MTDSVPANIPPQLVTVSDRWPLWMPPHRAARPEWTTPPHYWEHKRLTRLRDTIDSFAVSEPYRPVVWDVGAEEGDMPALYATWGADVVLIEPNPRVWPCIRYHWEVNGLQGPARSFVGLVGSEPSDLWRLEVFGPDIWPRCADGPMYPAHGFHHLREHAEVDAVATLDGLLGEVPAPDIVTVDIEGGEGHMLMGAERMLAEVRPIWFISVHSFELRELYGHNPSEHVHDVMRAHGYTGEIIEDRHEAHWMYLP